MPRNARWGKTPHFPCSDAAPPYLSHAAKPLYRLLGSLLPPGLSGGCYYAIIAEKRSDLTIWKLRPVAMQFFVKNKK